MGGRATLGGGVVTIRPIRFAVTAVCAALFVYLAEPDALPAQTRQYAPAEWNQTVDAGGIREGMRVSVEGRRAYAIDRVIHLQRVQGVFRLRASIVDTSAKSSRLLMTGKVIGGKVGRTGPIIDVDQMVVLPSEASEHLARRREIRTPEPDLWRKLGLWTRDLGEFYHDPELLDLADEVFGRGVTIERKALKDGDVDGLLKLAEQARKDRLDDSLVASLKHEAWFKRWRLAMKSSPAQADQFCADFAATFPSALVPATSPDAPPTPTDDVFLRYTVNPTSAYDSATLRDQSGLLRRVYVDTALHTLKARVEPTFANGFEIAAEVDRRIPEHSAYAEELREKTLAARAAEVDKLTRKEVLELAQDYRGRGQQPQALGVIEAWLSLRTKQLPADDTEGLLRIADDYRTLLERPRTADKLLMEAWAKSANPDVTAAIERAGYRLKGKQWLTAEEYNNRPEGRLEKALREGRIEAGMSAEQVTQSLGQPEARTRLITLGQTLEVWTYGGSGGASVVVQLGRRRRQDELRVTAVGKLPQ
jgi:hypothetical protein